MRENPDASGLTRGGADGHWPPGLLNRRFPLLYIPAAPIGGPDNARGALNA